MTETSYELTSCPVCASAQSVELLSADDARLEIEYLWEYHKKRLKPDVPPDPLTARVAFSQRAPLRLVRCDECGLVYRNPVERATDVAEMYEEEAPDQAVLQ